MGTHCPAAVARCRSGAVQVRRRERPSAGTGQSPAGEPRVEDVPARLEARIDGLLLRIWSVAAWVEPHMSATTDVPILLLDVDGVLNAARVDLPDGWKRGMFNGYVLSWDPTVTKRLRELHESGRVEIQWLTTWTTAAARLLAEPMGLPRGLKTHARAGSAPTGFLGRLGGRSGWWELDLAREAAEAEPDRRIVWIDDDLAQQAAETGEWLAAHPHVLVVAPDLVAGLTHKQLDEIEAWL